MKLLLTLALVVPITLFGQIPLRLKTLEFLELNKSTLADTKKLVGKPTRQYKHNIDDPSVRYDYVLEYQNKGLTLRFDCKTNLLLAIDLKFPSTLDLVPNIKLGQTDSSSLIQAIGRPQQRIWEQNLNVYALNYFDEQMNEYSFVFDSEAILQQFIASSKKYGERLIISR